MLDIRQFYGIFIIPTKIVGIMKFSTKTTYGLRAMIRLAENYSQGSLSLGKIAELENISLAYLERLFASLKKAKLVKSVRGASGGYELSSEPKRISAFEIIKALEGGFEPFHCLVAGDRKTCATHCGCGATKGLGMIEEGIESSLKKINLSELAG